MLRKMLVLIFVGSLLGGCATTPDEVARTAAYTYPIDDTLEVQIEFESEQAVYAIQVGLSMLSKARELKKPIRVEDPEFFPEYFALVNINIEDGLLYVSNVEAKNFVRVVYLEYQKKVAPPDYLRKLRKRSTFDSMPK